MKNNISIFKKTYSQLKNEGHIKLVDCDGFSSGNIKVKKAIPTTEKGKLFLKGSDAIIGDIKNDIGGY